MPCASSQVNGTAVSVMRDTGSTVCMVKSTLVKPEQMTGSYDWCVLVDGTMKRYPTAVGYRTHRITPVYLRYCAWRRLYKT